MQPDWIAEKIAKLKQQKAELLKHPPSLYRNFEIILVEQSIKRWSETP